MENSGIEFLNQKIKNSTANNNQVLLKRKAFFNKKYLFLALVLILLILFLIIVYENFFKKPVFISPFLGEGKTLAIATSSAKTKKIIAFLPSWQIGKGVKVNPEKLTELIYFSLPVDEKGNFITKDNNNISPSAWKYLNSSAFLKIKSKLQSKKVKVSLAIACFDNETIDKIISNSIHRQNLIDNLNKIIKSNGFDGLNIDFEYIPETDFPTRKYFNLFIKELTNKLKEKNPNLLISIDVNANAVLYDKPFDMETIGKYVDEIIIMGYDFRRQSSNIAGPVSPLRSRKGEKNITDTFKAIYPKVAKEKLILAVPFYGYEWQTVSTDYQSPTYPKTGALATYKRIRKLIKSHQVDKFWDRYTLTPYLVYQKNNLIKQIYYEDENSLSLKMEFIYQLKLGGVAIWALGYEGDYPEVWQVISKN